MATHLQGYIAHMYMANKALIDLFCMYLLFVYSSRHQSLSLVSGSEIENTPAPTTYWLTTTKGAHFHFSTPLGQLKAIEFHAPERAQAF